MTLLPLDVDKAKFESLIARSRANAANSRRLCDWARVLTDRSARLCPTPIMGSSDGSEREPFTESPRAHGHPHPETTTPTMRRAVLVLVHDPLMRAFVADAIRGDHDIIEASDVPSAVKAVMGGGRVDIVVTGCFEARALEACATGVRALYESCPWIPVAVIADTPPTFKADVLLTGVRAFLAKDFTPTELTAVVARVGRRPDATVPTGVRVAAVKQTFTTLERMLADVPPLATLAAMVSMSRSHFSRTFHAVAGIPLRDYVRDLRLKRAQELMRSSRLSLSAIASEAGFYDLPHFNKAFRHRFGMSPTQFRLAALASASSSTT
jgi:AraC-like DNA-binding protein